MGIKHVSKVFGGVNYANFHVISHCEIHRSHQENQRYSFSSQKFSLMWTVPCRARWTRGSLSGQLCPALVFQDRHRIAGKFWQNTDRDYGPNPNTGQSKNSDRVRIKIRGKESGQIPETDGQVLGFNFDPPWILASPFSNSDECATFGINKP